MTKTERIYLDYAATTPVRDEVLRCMQATAETTWQNASALYQGGRRARASLEQSRTTIADLLKLDPKGLVFTSGATEANNLLVRSNAYKLRSAGKGNHIIISKIEHPSVYELCRQLEKEGFRVTYLEADPSGKISMAELEENLSPDTILVSVMTVNNETGVIQPVQEIAELLRERNVFFHTDFVQAAGKVSFTPGEVGADAYSITAHKIYGPKGIGLAWQDPAWNLRPLILGGHQEADKRAGTESVVLAAGFAKALELSLQEQAQTTAKLNELEEYLFSELNKTKLNYERNAAADKIPAINNIWFRGLKSDRALILLDLAGIELSAGSACAAGSLEPSRILASMYRNDPDKDLRLEESLRISMGRYTTKADIDSLVQKLQEII